MKRLLAITLVALGIGVAGCGGPNSVQRAEEACAAHGGIGYLNLDAEGDVDELSCADGGQVPNK